MGVGTNLQLTYDLSRVVDPARAEEYRAIVRKHRWNPAMIVQTEWFWWIIYGAILAASIFSFTLGDITPRLLSMVGFIIIMWGGSGILVNGARRFRVSVVEKDTSHIRTIDGSVWGTVRRRFIVPSEISDTRMWEVLSVAEFSQASLNRIAATEATLQRIQTDAQRETYEKYLSDDRALVERTDRKIAMMLDPKQHIIPPL